MMSELEVNMASQHGKSTVQHGRTDGRTHEESTCVPNRLTSATCAGGAEANVKEGERFPVIRTGQRAEIPLDVRRAVYRRDGYRCKLCGNAMEDGRLDLDHIVPWSAGGSDFSQNLRSLCTRCNEGRSNYRLHGDSARVLPVTWWCVECHNIGDPEDVREFVSRPAWVRPAPSRFDPHDRMTFAYCATCDINSYAEVTL